MDNTLIVGCLEDENIFENFRVENNYILQEYNPEACQLYKVNSQGELAEVNDYSTFKFHDLRTNTMYKCERKEKYYRHLVISTDVVKIYGRDVVLDDYKINSRGLELKYNYEIVQTITEKDGFIIVVVNDSYLLFKVKGYDKIWTRVITGNRFIFKDLSTDKKFTYLVDGSSVQLLDVINPIKQSMVLKFVEGYMNITDSYSNFLNSSVRVHLINMNNDQETLIPQPAAGAKLDYSYNVECKFDGEWKVSLGQNDYGSITFQSMDKGKIINESYYISNKNNTVVEQSVISDVLAKTITDNSYFVYDGKQYRLYVQDSSNISEGQKITVFREFDQFDMTVEEKKGNILIVSGDNLSQQNLFSSQALEVKAWSETKIKLSEPESQQISVFQESIVLKDCHNTTVQNSSYIYSYCSDSDIINCEDGLSMGKNNFISSNSHLVFGDSTASLGNDLITLGHKVMNLGKNNLLKGDNIAVSGYETLYEYNGQSLNLLDIDDVGYAILGRFGKVIIENQGIYHEFKVKMPLPGLIMTSECKSSVYNIVLESQLDGITYCRGKGWICDNHNNLIQGSSINVSGVSNIVHGSHHMVKGKNSYICGSNNNYSGRHFFKAVQKKDVLSAHYNEFKEPFELQVGDSITMVPNLVNPDIIQCKVLSVDASNNFLTFTVDQPTISSVYYFVEVFQPSCVIFGQDNVSTNGNMTVGDHNINRSENCLLVGSQNQSFGKLYNVDYCKIDSKYVVNTLITESEGKLLAVYHSHISEVDYKDGVMKEDGFHFKIEGDRPSQCAFINQHGKGGAVIGNKNLIADQGLIIGEDNRCLSSSLVVGDHNTSSYQNSICVGQSIKDLADGSLNIGSESRQINFISASIINNKVFFGQHKTINLNKNIMYRLSLKIMIMNEDEVHFLDYDRFTAFFNEVSKLSDKELFFPTLDAKLIVDYCEESLGFHIEDEKQWNGMMNLQIDSLKC